MELDDIIISGIQHQMFDAAVNMGVPVAIRIMQESVGMPKTGVWSKKLKNVINSYGKLN